MPYLSDAFLDLVTVAVDAAAAHGLAAHLYDEFPYPSGVAGGAVVMGRPDLAATHLTQQVHDLPAGGHVRLELPPGEALACQAYPLGDDGAVLWPHPTDLLSSVGMLLTEESFELMGLTAYNRKRYFAARPRPVLDATLPPRPYRLFVSVQEPVTWHKYWGQFADVCNREAVERFLDLTHRRYVERLAPRFGRAIASIYTDEVAPGWSRLLPAEFERRCGYELPPLLPALQDATHPRHAAVTRDLWRVTHDLFAQAFERPVAAWCARHGLRYTGEKPSARLAQLRYMDWPGCEPGHTKAGAPTDLLGPEIRQNARATASAAYFYGKEGALCECFHSLGWSGTLQDARLIAEGLVLMGIRFLSPHGFFYSTHGLRKHDAPPSFFFQMPYWPLFGLLSQRLERVFQRFKGTHIDAEILVVEPSSGLPTHEQREAYARCLGALHETRRDFLVADTDVLREAGARGGRLHARDIAARVVAVPPMRWIEPALDERLAEIEAAGVAVVRWDDPAETAAAVTRILAAVPPALRIAVAEGDAAEAEAGAGDCGTGADPLARLQMVTRRGPGGRCWFLIHSGAQPLTVAFEAGTALREVPLDPTAPVGPLAPAPAAGPVYVRRFAPFESVLLEECAEAAGALAAAEAAPAALRIPVRGRFAVRPLAPNLLRMNDWDLTVEDDSGAPAETARVEALPLVNQLETGRLRFAPRIEHTFGLPARLALPELRLRYHFAFDCAFAAADLPAVALVMEPDSIRGEWTLTVNDSPAFTAADFALPAPDAAQPHVRGSQVLAVAPYLRPGANAVTLAVRTGRADGGLRTPLYLAGDFGVGGPGLRAIGPRPATGAFEDYDGNGLPFYSGVIEYTGALDWPAETPLPAAPNLAELDFEAPFEQACEVAVNGGAWQAAPWSPYRVALAPGVLHSGANALAIRVYTSLIRSFEGQWFDPASHAYRPVGGQ